MLKIINNVNFKPNSKKVKIYNKSKYRILIETIKSKNEDLFENTLINFLKNKYKEYRNYDNIVSMICYYGTVFMLITLENYVKIGYKDENFIDACIYGNLNIVKYIYDKKYTSINFINKNKSYIIDNLKLVCYNKHLHVLKYLVGILSKYWNDEEMIENIEILYYYTENLYSNGKKLTFKNGSYMYNEEYKHIKNYLFEYIF